MVDSEVHARRYTQGTHLFIPTRRIWHDYGCQMILGDRVGLKVPDICPTGEEKTPKNLTKETCPDRGSNPSPLRDRRACYRLFHSGGLFFIQIYYIQNNKVHTMTASFFFGFQNYKTLYVWCSESRKLNSLPPNQTQESKNCIYNIPCECGKQYIGETCRPLQTRLNEVEHKRNTTNEEIDKSKLAEHS